MGETIIQMDILSELKALENKNIFVNHKYIALGSDEWGFSYRITWLPKKYDDNKRRSPHMLTYDSFSGGGATYSGAWDTQEQALTAGIKFANEHKMFSE